MKQYPYVYIISAKLSEESYLLVLKQLKLKVFYGIRKGYFLWGHEALSAENLKISDISTIIFNYPIRTRTCTGETTQYIHVSSLNLEDRYRLALDIRHAILLKYKGTNNE